MKFWDILQILPAVKKQTQRMQYLYVHAGMRTNFVVAAKMNLNKIKFCIGHTDRQLPIIVNCWLPISFPLLYTHYQPLHIHTLFFTCMLTELCGRTMYIFCSHRIFVFQETQILQMPCKICVLCGFWVHKQLNCVLRGKIRD